MEAVVLRAVAQAVPDLDGRPEGVGQRGTLPVHVAPEADLAACLHAGKEKGFNFEELWLDHKEHGVFLSSS